MKNLKPFIESYINNFNPSNWDEEYKWKALKHFQDHYHDSSSDLASWILSVFGKTRNLLVAPNYYPLGVLRDLAKARPEETKQILLALFDEKIPYQSRIKQYVASFNSIFNELKNIHYYPKWKETTQTYQDSHAISVYLFLRHPDKHYIYKWSVFNDFANLIDYKINSKNSFEKYYEFSELCENIKKEILQYKELISTYKNWLKSNDRKYIDPDYNLLVQDFIYTIVSHIHPQSILGKFKNKSVAKNCITIKSSDFLKTISNASKTFKPSKVDFEKKDMLRKALGLDGEIWAKTYEEERLRKLGIDLKIEHTSVERGDGLGYDILSVEDDGETLDILK